MKLAEDRFNLAVVGQFKRGKSSLMNAVIGRDLLPTGLLPLTSAITALCFGPQEKIILKRAGWALDQEIELNELADFVTEQGNPGNQKGVIEVRIEMPVPFLRRGLYFVDTPGIGSTHQANTATTYNFLPQADAIIFVTSVDAPLSEAEERFLQDIQEHVRRLFVVVNKIDLVSPQEQNQVLSYIRSGLTHLINASNIEIYPLSARQALQSKQQGNLELLEASGLPAFEKRLENFLAEEKAHTFLLSILDDLASILAETSTDGSEISTLRARVNASREQLSNGSPVVIPHEALDSPSRAWVGISDATEVKPTQILRKTRTCPVCDALSRSVFDFFVAFQNSLGKDAQMRKEFADMQGFCNVHTWQFQSVAAPQDISAGYAAFVEVVASILRGMAHDLPSQGAEYVARLLVNHEHCPACDMLRKEQSAQCERFLEYASTSDGQTFYRQSLGLCLPHLQMILALHPSEEVMRFLLNEQAEHFNDLAHDMRSYVLKREALRRGLVNSNEENAWRRALVQIVGERTAHIPQIKVNSWMP